MEKKKSNLHALFLKDEENKRMKQEKKEKKIMRREKESREIWKTKILITRKQKAIFKDFKVFIALRFKHFILFGPFSFP